MNAGKRVLLLVAYVVVALVLSWFFMLGTGLPLAVFGSWGWLLISHLEGDAVLLAIIFLLYSLILFAAATAQARLSEMKYPYLTFVGHGTGCLLAFFNSPFIERGWAWQVVGFLVAVPIVALYMLIDWRLAKRGSQALTPDLTTGPDTTDHAS